MKLQTDLHRHPRTSAAWRAAFPLHDFEAGDLHTPPNLEVPLDAIDQAGQFPPFFLLGRRNDASFRRDANDMVIEYDWPRHSSTPVARISVRGNSGVMVEQPWNGERPGFSFGRGKTLGSALQYPLLGQQAFRDARLTHAGSDGSERVEPFTLDVREEYFANLLPRETGLAVTLPVHGRTCVVEHPARNSSSRSRRLGVTLARKIIVSPPGSQFTIALSSPCLLAFGLAVTFAYFVAHSHHPPGDPPAG